MIKFHFLFDKNVKAKKLEKFLLKKYKNYQPKKSTHIIIGGGDGFMLNSLKKLYKYNKPFYGINCGSYGFLMNNYNFEKLEKKIVKSKKISIDALSINVLSDKNNKNKIIAINELSLFRQSRQTASLSLKVGKKNLIKKLIGDGVLVSTPAGSTAYNLSIHGPILDLDSGKLAITPISPFRPRRWSGKIISSRSEVILFNLDPKKRPVAAVADNIEIRNVKKVTVKTDKKIKIFLLYDTNRNLVKRIKLEQLRKNKI